MTGGPHPVLDSGAASLRVLARLDLDGRPLALVEATVWTVVEIPPAAAAAAVAGTWWFGQPVSPAGSIADVGAAP